MTTETLLIVGAGFAGAVYARSLADAGWRIRVIDQRNHIAGNAYDYVDQNGVRVHRYGPHLFHTNTESVVQWLRRFGNWAPYFHRVRVMLGESQFVPLPINLTTINAIFDVNLYDEASASAFLEAQSERIERPTNAAEYLYSKIGRKMTDLFFRPYTRKMWALDLEEMDDSVVRRIPIRFDLDDRYFPNDSFQMLPNDGYTKLFERILDHKKITVELNCEFERGMEKDFTYCFNSMPIDVFFEYEFGELPYRSIRFHTRTAVVAEDRAWSVTNFADDKPFTRETWWHRLPNHLIADNGLRSLTLEEPCDYRSNKYERYYPVKAADGRYQKLYKKYKELADKMTGITFIGRCGTYQYLDMDQVINQSLMGAERWLRSVA